MTVKATDAKQKFGYFLNEARIKPVIIEKSGRETAALISIERYRELQAIEDAYWIAQAEAGIQSGFVGPEKTAEFLREKMDVELRP